MQIALTNSKGEDLESRYESDAVPRVGERVFIGEHLKSRTYEVLAVTYCTHKAHGAQTGRFNLADCTVKRVKN